MLKEEVEAYYDWNDEKNHKIAQDTRCPCWKLNLESL
jgi:hypothetical protein